MYKLQMLIQNKFACFSCKATLSIQKLTSIYTWLISKLIAISEQNKS